MSLKRTWLKFRLAAIGIAIDDCMRREAQAQQAISKLVKREMHLRRELSLTPAPIHSKHIINFPSEA